MERERETEESVGGVDDGRWREREREREAEGERDQGSMGESEMARQGQPEDGDNTFG